MTYKHGIKEYVMTGVLFGAPMGLLFGLMYFDFILGIISGVVCGILFAFLIFLFVKFQEKQFAKKRAEMEKERRIICDGGATLDGNGGWMFFTDIGLEFYPHKINLSTKEVIIPASAIDGVRTAKNQLIISTDGKDVAIVVSHNKEWKKRIESALN